MTPEQVAHAALQLVDDLLELASDQGADLSIAPYAAIAEQAADLTAELDY
jgi:hypothetical protein